MNTPPIHRRRRGDAGADALPETPPHCPEQAEEAAFAPGESSPRRRPARPQAAVAASPRRGRRRASPLEGVPAPMRAILLALCVILFFTATVAITRNYLIAQEERRRLEAEAAERAQHPLYYGDIILSYAQGQSLDPALVAAVILCESSYDPQAESRLGARGLMQLMEDTAGWIAHKLDEDDASYTFDKLYDPETNIRYGTWYLGYLSRRFDGDATKIVCAYHAGQGNVDSWLNNPQYSSDGVTLDVIPTRDTATYAERVLRARDVYRKYYFPLPTPEPDAPSAL
ncbi:MAG: lytic transglycosylase domain-containing protein [Clostridia bacterium]|nr:lytic transglycosylase domain-containing protein [Clostridia bacterium]